MPTTTFPTLSAGYSSQQITAVVWGTDGLLQSPAPNPSSPSYAGTGYYVVVRESSSEKVDLDYGENGTGIEVRRTILKHGKRWNLTVVDDLSMTPPSVGTTVTIVDILAGPNASTSNTGTYNTIVATVIDNSYEAAQKQPGQRVIQVEYLTLVGA